MKKIVFLIMCLIFFADCYSQIKLDVEMEDSVLVERLINIATFDGITKKETRLYRETYDAGKSFSRFDMFFIRDLTDLTNYRVRDIFVDSVNTAYYKPQSIKFIKNHVYIFDVTDFYVGAGNIMYITSDEIIIFQSVKCGDNMEKALEYFSSILPDENKEVMLDRIKKIKGYGLYERYYITDRFRCENLEKILDNKQKSYESLLKKIKEENDK